VDDPVVHETEHLFRKVAWQLGDESQSEIALSPSPRDSGDLVE
jgi:hypothetical protein